MAYEGYEGRCVGTLLRYLYRYSHMADQWIFDTKKVYGDYGCKNLIATYHWMNDTNIPIFKFTKEYKHLYGVQSMHLKYNIAHGRFPGISNPDMDKYRTYIHKWNLIEIENRTEKLLNVVG